MCQFEKKASFHFSILWNLIDERSTPTHLSKSHQENVDHPSQIELLWQVCNIPDYRQEADSNHVHLLEEVTVDYQRRVL